MKVVVRLLVKRAIEVPRPEHQALCQSCPLDEPSNQL